MEFIKKNLISIAFALLVVRSFVVGSQFGDALALIAISSIIGLNTYIESKRAPDINDDLKKEIESIRAYVSAMSLKQGLKETVKQENQQREFKRFF